MNNELISILMFVALIVVLLLGVPVAFALAGVATIFGLFAFGENVILQFLLATWDVMKMYSLLAVPLFVFMGSLLAKSGVTERLYNSLYQMLGGFKGGLGVTTIIISIFFGACTGVIGAAVITMAIIALPSMLEKGYDSGLATGSIAAGGCLGLIIPPSIMLIIYGSESGTSISQLFTGALIPGILLGTLYACYVALICIIKPSLGPAIPLLERKKIDSRLIKTFIFSLLPVLALIAFVLGSIMVGIAAPSEAASLGAIGSLFVCAIYKTLNLRIIKESVIVALKITSMVVFIVLGAKFFTTVFFRLGGHHLVSQFVVNLELSQSSFFLIIMILLLVLGMFMDWIGLMMVFIPVFNPMVKDFGFEPLWYGIMFCMVLCVSLLTPPFAYAVFYLKGVAPPTIKLSEMYLGSVPFLIINTLIVVLLFYMPILVTWLPYYMTK